MGLVLLCLLYLLTAVTLAVSVRPEGRPAGPAAILALSALPLAFTWQGFLPERTLAPTNLLVGTAPWADPRLVEEVEGVASPRNPVLLDPVSEMLPWSAAARRHLLFTPAEGSGAALLANGQSALLFPTEVISRLLAPFRGTTYSQAARLLVAAWGMFLLLRIGAIGEPAAVAGCTVFVGAGFLQLWRLHPHSLVTATAPWILTAAVLLVRRPGPGPAVGLAASGAVAFFGGHPETLYQVLVFALLTVPLLARLDKSLGERESKTLRRSRTGGLIDLPVARWGVVAAGLSLLLAGPLLVPFVENLRVSAEWQLVRGKRASGIVVDLPRALERLRPAVALYSQGDPVKDSWQGPENLAEIGGGSLGAPALLLILLAVAGQQGPSRQRHNRGDDLDSRQRRRNRWSLRGLALIGAVGLLVSSHMPLVSIPFGWVPLLRDSLLKRLSVWWVLAGSLLAAWAVDEIGERFRPARTLLTALAAALVGLLVVAASTGAPREELGRIWGWEIAPLVVTAVAALLMTRARRPAPRAGWVWAAAVLLAGAVLLPRAVLFASWVPTVPPAGFYAPTPALEVVKTRLGALSPWGFRVTGIEGALAPHSAAFFDLEEVRAYDPMTFAPYTRFLSAVGEAPRTGWVRISAPRPALSFLGVRFLFDQPREDQVDEDPAYRGADAIVWENPAALPRAFFPARLHVDPDPMSAVRRAREIRDFAALAVVDTVAGHQGGELGEDAWLNPRARVLDLEVRLDEIRAVVRAASPAVLATSQPAIPGWKLLLDGDPAPSSLRRINGAFLGVAVPEGRTRVELRYAPTSWRWGWALAGLGSLLCLSLLLRARARQPWPRLSRRRHGSDHSR